MPDAPLRAGPDIPPADPDIPPEEVGAGAPDQFERLWTPHRMAYIKGESKPTEPGPRTTARSAEIPKLSDEDGLIVARGELVVRRAEPVPVQLRAPAWSCPYRHVADYTELTAAETAELALLTQRAIRALRKASGAHGFNVGMNLGTVAGAGIAAHLHQHVVPRWGGDTNFMPVIGQTRVLPQLLARHPPDPRRRLAPRLAGPA